MLLLLGLMSVTPVLAGGATHSDPIAPVLLGVTGVLFFAIAGRYLARLFRQPTVLGELVMGIFLGNLIYALGGDFILVLREGTALFDVVNMSLQGEDLRQAVYQRISNPDEAEKLLAVITG